MERYTESETNDFISWTAYQQRASHISVATNRELSDNQSSESVYQDQNPCLGKDAYLILGYVASLGPFNPLSRNLHHRSLSSAPQFMSCCQIPTSSACHHLLISYKNLFSIQLGNFLEQCTIKLQSIFNR